ncbi:hypothetical protein CG428_08075 [Pantoea ananatis]|nr:hypothetical protein CG428_08075 [Pantoea ananatis]
MTCANLLSQRRPGEVVSQQQERGSNQKIAANADTKAAGITLFSKGGGKDYAWRTGVAANACRQQMPGVFGRS